MRAKHGRWLSSARPVAVPSLWIGVLALAGVFLLPGTAPAATQVDATEADVRARAAAGDPLAQQALRDLDAFRAEMGGDVASGQVAEQLLVGDIPVRLNGLAPLWLNAGIDVVISTKSELQEYVFARRAVIDQLAATAPSDVIRFQLTPSGHRSIPEIWDVLNAEDVTAGTLMVDVMSPDGVWLARFTHRAADDVGDEYLSGSGKDVEARVRATLAEAYSAGEIDMKTARLEVFLVRASGRADALQRLADHPLVLLVDPEADVLAAIRTRAAHVRVVMMPTVPDEIRWSQEK